MTRTCTVCNHNDVDAINRARLNGEPYRRIAAQFGLSDTALRRHCAEHLPVTLTRASEARAIASAEQLLAEFERLYAEACELRQQAREAGSGAGWVVALAESRRLLETLHNVRQAMEPAAPLTDEREAILNALRPYPAAMLAVLNVLETHNGYSSTQSRSI